MQLTHVVYLTVLLESGDCTRHCCSHGWPGRMDAVLCNSTQKRPPLCTSYMVFLMHSSWHAVSQARVYGTCARVTKPTTVSIYCLACSSEYRYTNYLNTVCHAMLCYAMLPWKKRAVSLSAGLGYVPACVPSHLPVQPALRVLGQATKLPHALLGKQQK